MDRKKVRSNFMLVLTTFIWGLIFVAQNVGVGYTKPFTFNVTRFFIGGMALIPLIFVMKKRGEKTPVEVDGPMSTQNNREITQRRRTGIVGGICCEAALFVASAFQQFGITQASVGKVGFTTTLYIIVVPILGIFMKRKVAVTMWVNVTIATMGIYLLRISGGSMTVSRGNLLVFICSVCFSLHILVIDYFSPKVDGVFLPCVQFFAAGMMAVVSALILGHPTMASLIAAWAPVLHAGVMSCSVAYTLQVVAQKDTDPVVTSLILSLESVSSLLAGWVLLGQKLSPKELFGCVLAFAAILLTQLPEEVSDWKKADKVNLQQQG